MDKQEIYAILVFRIVHDWATCFERVLYCGSSAAEAKKALTEASDSYDVFETQVWSDGVQIRRNLYSSNKDINNLFANDS
jgi:hypothetical protein